MKTGLKRRVERLEAKDGTGQLEAKLRRLAGKLRIDYDHLSGFVAQRGLEQYLNRQVSVEGTCTWEGVCAIRDLIEGKDEP